MFSLGSESINNCHYIYKLTSCNDINIKEEQITILCKVNVKKHTLYTLRMVHSTLIHYWRFCGGLHRLNFTLNIISIIYVTL